MSSGDDALAGQVRRLLRRVDPTPAEVVAAARESFGWQALEAELAQLTADSLHESASVRGGGQARLISYQADDRGIELEVTGMDGRLRILGQVVPVGLAQVRVEQPAGIVEVTADQLGRFTIPDLPAGLTRFAWRSLGPISEPVGLELVTPWQAL